MLTWLSQRLSGQYSSPFRPGHNTLNGASSSSGGQRHDRSTHGHDINPALQRPGSSRHHAHSSPTRRNHPDDDPAWWPSKGKGHPGESPEAPPAKRPKVATQQTLDNSFSRASVPHSRERERVRDRPPASEVFEVQSSEDEPAVKRSLGFPTAPGPIRSHTASRSGSPQKSSPTRKLPGPHRLVSHSPEAEWAQSAVRVDDDEDEEEEQLESIEQFSSSAETIPSKMKPSFTQPVQSPPKPHGTAERRKAPMRKKDGSVQEPVQPMVSCHRDDSI